MKYSDGTYVDAILDEEETDMSADLMVFDKSKAPVEPMSS